MSKWVSYISTWHRVHVILRLMPVKGADVDLGPMLDRLGVSARGQEILLRALSTEPLAPCVRDSIIQAQKISEQFRGPPWQ